MSLRLLIVEDKADLRTMLRRLLERRGFEIIEACDGPQAVKLVASEKPDLILMDVALPHFDGLEATRQIRSLPEIGTVPILFLTAHTTRENVQRMQQAGGTDWMLKPFDIDDLMVKITECLKRRT
jgi:DNA-binding response OmpR family regulator